jgi:hypothetical protein
MENLTTLQINISDISIIFSAFIAFVFIQAGIISTINLVKRS